MTWTLAMVNAFYHPYSGGTEKHLYELSRRLARRHNIIVITSQLESTERYEKIEGVRIHRLKAKLYRLPHLYPPPYPVCRELYGEMGRLHRKYGFDFVNLHGRWFPSFNKSIDFAKKNHVKSVLTLHNGRPEGIDLPTTLVGKVYEGIWGKEILRRVDRIIAVSEGVKREIAGYGIDEKKMHVIHNGVDTDFFRPKKPIYREKYGAGFDHVIIFSGRLVKQKGIEYLMDAMKIVLEEYRKTGLIIVGEGALRESMEKRAKRLGISENVVFTGFLPEKELPYMFSSTDLMVLPSISEPFGIALIEALATGIPAIGTRVGGIPEMIKDGINGFLVNPRNSEEMAEKIITLLSDEDLRIEMGKEARKIAVKEFDWSIIAEKTEKFYSEWV